MKKMLEYNMNPQFIINLNLGIDFTLESIPRTDWTGIGTGIIEI